MRTIRIFLGLLAATVALATAGTAAAEDVYTCPVEDVIGFRKMEEGATADNKFGWAMDVDTLQPEDIIYQLTVSDDGWSRSMSAPMAASTWISKKSTASASIPSVACSPCRQRY